MAVHTKADLLTAVLTQSILFTSYPTSDQSTVTPSSLRSTSVLFCNCPPAHHVHTDSSCSVFVANVSTRASRRHSQLVLSFRR
jgi:hypothetical protein